MLISATTPDLLLSLVASATLLERAAAAFPGPAARSRPFDPAAVRQNHRIVHAHAPAFLVAGAQDEGKAGGGEGGTIIAFSGSVLGDARRPLSSPGRAQQAVYRSGRCAEKLLVGFLV